MPNVSFHANKRKKSFLFGPTVKSLWAFYCGPEGVIHNAKVDVSNLEFDLKHAPNVCGCYVVCFSCSPTSIE